MPRAYRPCRSKGCPDLALPGEHCCPAHKGNPALENNRGNPLHHFYNSAIWKTTRLRVLHRYPLCAASSKYDLPICHNVSTDAHHVIPAKDYIAQGGNFYDLSNLLGVCHTCHTIITALERSSTYPTA